MNNSEIGRYLKILSKTTIPVVFEETNQKVFELILNNIKNQIIKELTTQEKLIKDYEYIKNSIISFSSILNIYNKNYIYLENEENIEKHINTASQKYFVFKSRTPDFDKNPIYTYITTNLENNMITMIVENRDNIIIKFVVFNESDHIIAEILIEDSDSIDKIFGERILIDNIKIEDFKNFIKSNIVFLKNNEKLKKSIDIHFE
jgi:hypothetical protein